MSSSLQTSKNNPAALAAKIRDVASKRDREAAAAQNPVDARELTAAAESYRALADAVAGKSAPLPAEAEDHAPAPTPKTPEPVNRGVESRVRRLSP